MTGVYSIQGATLWKIF